MLANFRRANFVHVPSGDYGIVASPPPVWTPLDPRGLWPKWIGLLGMGVCLWGVVIRDHDVCQTCFFTLFFECGSC